MHFRWGKIRLKRAQETFHESIPQFFYFSFPNNDKNFQVTQLKNSVGYCFAIPKRQDLRF
jgi:hypothetical protein